VTTTTLPLREKRSMRESAFGISIMMGGGVVQRVGVLSGKTVERAMYASKWLCERKLEDRVFISTVD
jgi:hypothetical protein